MLVTYTGNNYDLPELFKNYLERELSNNAIKKFIYNTDNKGNHRIIVINEIIEDGIIKRNYLKATINNVTSNCNYFNVNSYINQIQRNEEIRRLHEKEGLIQIEIADIFNLSQSTISNILKSFKQDKNNK